ncbi:ferric reductase-like transmembrane domain-containing protein [Candidatus Daviesbacteria bacterium]|nr:ferric reductase-like transmembrane domain-containing protein [Candidatus Daviesbacteria bacterium]
MSPKSLLTNIRFYILVFSSTLATFIFIWVKSTIQIETLQAVTLDRYYALIAVTYLYFALLATPLTKLFNLPFEAKYLKARRAIGVSAFIFGALHSYFAFFGELGGFSGLGFLSSKYILAITFGAIALLILFLMAATSFDFIIAKLTFPKWKALHRFVYLAGVVTVIHGLLLGSDFTQFSNLIPQIFLAALIILLSLEMFRLDQYLAAKFINFPKLGLSFSIFLILITIVGTIIYGPEGSSGSPFNIHAFHIQVAKQAQQNSSPNFSSNVLSNPGLQGDRTKRFTVSFIHPEVVEASSDANLKFQIFDASSGNQVQLYSFVYSKLAHLIIVDSQLNYFNHIHPDQTSEGFSLTTQFPHPGQYHLYLDFQPLGAIEQQFGFSLNVGKFDQVTLSDQKPDTNLTKTFDKYEVSLNYPKPLKATDVSLGNQKLTFTIKDAKTHQSITNLKPYLAAFGHLVMVNEQTFEYIHVHPTNLVAPKPDDNSGPTVEFLPLGLYGPIKTGIYRIFGQFNPDNNLFTADFTVKVD